MGDGNERNVLDEAFQARGKSNEERILELERDVNGRGGIFAVVEKLSGLVDKLVDKVGALDEKVDKRMDDLDHELQEVKRIVNEEKGLRLNKEEKALAARKPIVNEIISVLGALLVAATISFVTWLVTRGGV